GFRARNPAKNVILALTNRSAVFAFVMDGLATFKFSFGLRGAILAAQEEDAMQDRESHGKSIQQLVADFATHLEQGLTQKEAHDRLARYGAHELSERPRPGVLAPLWGQFNTPRR